MRMARREGARQQRSSSLTFAIDGDESCRHSKAPVRDDTLG